MKNEYVVRSGDKEFKVKLDSAMPNKGELNGKEFVLDIVRTKTGFHVLKDKKAYSFDVVEIDRENRTIEMRINHLYYKFQVKDQYDELLEKLGMDRHAGSKVSEIKAPMPGLVLQVLVNPGEEVNANQPLLILEAMKMENVIKSPVDSLVKKIEVNTGDSVEKNQSLILFG